MKNLISVILMVFLPLTLASDTQLRFKVYVSVSGDNETITTILTSHLKRELRALEDVDIVGIDDDWTYVIGVTYVEGELKGGVKTGSYHLRMTWQYACQNSFLTMLFRTRWRSNIPIVV